MKTLRRIGVVLACITLASSLVAAMLLLPPATIDLRAMVETQMPASGVEHPVTAVLLNFRGYDTLLEVAVLLLALVGMLAGTRVERRRRAAGFHPGVPLLKTSTRMLIPLMILVSGYLLWAGASRPGGAFQAAAVLGGAAVLLHLARIIPAWLAPTRVHRAGVVAGLLLFLLVAALPLLGGETLLTFPPHWAGALILLIETGLTASLGLLLAGLFLTLSDDGVEFQP